MQPHDAEETGPDACGWNGSLSPYKPAQYTPAAPTQQQREKLKQLRDEFSARAEKSRAQGLTL
ncbi:hypothetical protein C1M51_18435 [Methylibium sp. Pch-M]|uniref:hypothetical protein n=1 Tax=Methylibium sp. Pch-M TaxID=2082386 RepID=UPI0010139E0B|nr:hypothetical protein [Methylibium sp. Pch-M]QAZ41238.1 hypothetical protein C1M51_18435 [Methylibium sp. Pch-M]